MLRISYLQHKRYNKEVSRNRTTTGREGSIQAQLDRTRKELKIVTLQVRHGRRPHGSGALRLDPFSPSPVPCIIDSCVCRRRRTSERWKKSV